MGLEVREIGVGVVPDASDIGENGRLRPALHVDSEVQASTSAANLIGSVLGAVEGFLAAVGAIASILYPSRKALPSADEPKPRQEWGGRIRELFGVGEFSVLNPKPGSEDDVRGGNLHIDEIIDTILSAAASSEAASSIIEYPALGLTVSQVATAVRSLNAETPGLHARNRRGNLREIPAALGEISKRLSVSAKVRFVRAENGPSGPHPLAFAWGVEPRAEARRQPASSPTPKTYRE